MPTLSAFLVPLALWKGHHLVTFLPLFMNTFTLHDYIRENNAKSELSE